MDRASAYTADLKQRVAESLCREATDTRDKEALSGLPDGAEAVARVWVDRIRARVSVLVQATQWALVREGSTAAPTARESDQLWALMHGRPIRRPSVRMAQARLRRLQRQLSRLSSDRRSGVPVGEDALMALEREMQWWREWLAVVKQGGTEASRKGRFYVQGLHDVVPRLQITGLKRAPEESIALLWHCGFSRFSKSISVFSPHSGRTPDDSRRRIKERIRYRQRHGGLPFDQRAYSADVVDGDDVVLEFLQTALDVFVSSRRSAGGG